MSNSSGTSREVRTLRYFERLPRSVREAVRNARFDWALKNWLTLFEQGLLSADDLVQGGEDSRSRNVRQGAPESVGAGLPGAAGRIANATENCTSEVAMIGTNPMYAPELAKRIGIGLDRFYKNREKYRMVDGMPAPISNVGRMAWDRAGIEAWLTRNDPRRPSRLVAANDSIAPPMPNSDAEWNEFLRAHYAPSTAPA